MDALKKAEQAKQQGQAPRGGEQGAQDAPTSEPEAAMEGAVPARAAPADAGMTALPELPSRLEILDEGFLAQAPAEAEYRPRPNGTAPRPAIPRATAPRQTPGGSSAAQSSAQNLFAAKYPPAGNRPFVIAISAVTLAAVAGIGFYFWLQLQPSGNLKALRPLPAASGPTPIAAPVAPPAPAPARAAIAEQARPVAATEPTGRKDAVPAAAPPAPEAHPVSPIRITTSKPKLDPTLAQAFEALSAGNLAAARSGYERVLKGDPRNADALHGMAAIALREGRPDVAEAHHLRALEADPKDALALTGLIGLKGQGDILASESRLKTLLAGQPDQPALHFALGNLQARQGRWSEAQQSYFKAMAQDPDHPDYLFNLAVSLDHLRQDAAAAQHYRRALAAAADRPGSFDRAQAETRLRELQP